MIDEKTRMWTVRDLMKFAIDHLQRNGIAEARLNVELLLAHALDCPRINLYTNFDKPVSKEELKRFRSVYERRLNREPVQYIVGSTSFMGLSFEVNRNVLIPRPETETLVEQVMLACSAMPEGKAPAILEVGTGSGNIVVALAKFVKHGTFTSIDSNAEALDLARRNARRHGVEDAIQYEHMDVFEPFDQFLRQRYDILLSNPPYVARDEWEQLQPEVRRFEPAGAITDGRDGLQFYRRLIEMAPLVLNDHGAVFFEMGFGQEERIQALLHQAKFDDITVVDDMQEIPRVVSGTCRATARNVASIN